MNKILSSRLSPVFTLSANFQHTVWWMILPLLFLGPLTATAQQGFYDDFEDSSLDIQMRNNQVHTVWSTRSPGTYGITEEQGTLHIDFSKKDGVGADDHFTCSLPRPVQASGNPRITLKVKSSVGVTLTLRPTYSMKPPTYEYLTTDIKGDSKWHTYTFNLYSYLYERFSIQKVDFYIDKGNTETRSATIEIDDLKIAGYLIEVIDPAAEVLNGNTIHLNWKTSRPDDTGAYRIFRDSEPRFKPGNNNYLAETTSPEYIDGDLDPNGLYYYKIIPSDTRGNEYYPSEGLRVETYERGASPSVEISGVNSARIKKYEKFELHLNLTEVSIHNPYDPDDIDVYSWFKSPSGDTMRINGFYDNYMGVDQWKIRFSPDEVGSWQYQVSVTDAAGSGSTSIRSFEAIPSDHHGWITPSEINPHYFRHDDGTSFYITGVYSPWRNDLSRFETYKEHGANLLAIWNIDYGGLVNEHGMIENELGRYNQTKLGRLDSMVNMLEKRDIKLMYAIWPHDLFSATVWATAWDRNPYRHIVDVVDVYSDELAWEYQKKKYRYLIARYSYSRSWGIWELMNEMNGTDGWKEARYLSAYEWVEKADRYFQENDPYNHPLTASFSGGYDQYRPWLYKVNDVPNLHMYPEQGWVPRFPLDSVRSAMYNYAWASRRFWENFDKPAIFGEAGADLAYFEQEDPRYHDTYHNAIWASLSNGLAGTPVWWQFRHLSDRDWDHLQYLQQFVSDIDFANKPYNLADISAPDADVYGLSAGDSGFGWVRTYQDDDIGGVSIIMEGYNQGEFEVRWYDTWSGAYLDSEKVVSVDGNLNFIVPIMNDPHPDIAFRVEAVDE